MANASPARLDARQSDRLATCVITTTPSSVPSPESAGLEEFILILMVDERVFNEFQNGFPPGAGVITGTTSFSGSGSGLYTVTKSLGSPILTADQTRGVMRAWAGQAFTRARQVWEVEIRIANRTSRFFYAVVYEGQVDGINRAQAYAASPSTTLKKRPGHILDQFCWASIAWFIQEETLREVDSER
ncbi:hypothetical protein FA13DRAFT_1839051 [Coprinellus micaceus]|uniref:Uncharacterized protein n=1 Tax=Coprinellus micaceus TaxID=71717 RepID=A0A4Y7SFF1_COPMI|nr:hypothetical protein FA13DRAFT_1839051 [Coprinellus micaceus]